MTNQLKLIASLAFLLVLSACGGRKGSVVFEARLDNIDRADLLIISPDGGISNVDTLHLVKGRGERELALTGGPYTFVLLYPNLTTIRFMASEGQTVKIRGDVQQLGQEKITGCDSILPPDSLVQELPLRVGQAMPKDSVLEANTKEGKPLLIAFWANWKSGSNPSYNLRQALNAHPDSLAGLAYSLDVDPVLYNSAYRDPKTSWGEHCDYLGFQSPLVRRLGLTILPYYILVDEQGRIAAHGSEYSRDVKPHL